MNINGISSNSSPIALVENLIEGNYTFTLKVWTSASKTAYGANTVKVHVDGTSPDMLKYSNRVRMNINANPFKFVELEEHNFLSKLELLLQKPNLSLGHPKITITNVEQSVDGRDKSTVAIEFYVMNMNENGSYSVVQSATVMSLLYKLKYDYNRQYLDFNVNSILPMQCNSTTCSAHGQCDPITFKCVCKQFWMQNLYKLYFSYESDPSFGNNCG